jgi:hypothetical protein
MHTYELWVRLNPYQTAHVRVQASNALQAKMLGESMYGRGNVLNYTQV